MAYSGGWDETDPANSKNPKLGAADIRTLRVDVRERKQGGGHFMAESGTDQADGKHECGDASPENESEGEFTIYESTAHATDHDTPALRVGDGAATLADTVTLGDGRAATGGDTRPYTLDVADITADTLDLDETLAVAGAATLAGLLQLDDKLVITAQDISQAAHPYTAADETVIIATITADTTIELPAVAGVEDRVYMIVNGGGSTQGKILTIDPDGTEAIPVGTTYTLDRGESVIIQSDGTRWQVLSAYRRNATTCQQDSDTSTSTFTTTYATVNTVNVYVPAGGLSNRVLLTWSGTFVFDGNVSNPAPTIDVRFLKDDVELSGSEFIRIMGGPVITIAIPLRISAEFLDTSPTEGATHVYKLQIKTSEALGTSSVVGSGTAPRILTATVHAA